jgi:hypothetical protein
MQIIVSRTEYTDDTTIGILYIDGIRFCWTLEDTVRAHGIKVKNHTAIPAGTYNIDVTMSNRFKRMMPILFNQKDRVSIKAGGISFAGIRIHGGNTHQNTEGCILVAYNRPGKETIQGTAEAELTGRISAAKGAGKKITITIENTPQNA